MPLRPEEYPVRLSERFGADAGGAGALSAHRLRLAERVDYLEPAAQRALRLDLIRLLD